MSKLLYESMVNRAKDINLDFTPTKKESSVYDNVEDDMFFNKVVQEADESTANEPQTPDAGDNAPQQPTEGTNEKQQPTAGDNASAVDDTSPAVDTAGGIDVASTATDDITDVTADLGDSNPAATEGIDNTDTVIKEAFVIMEAVASKEEKKEAKAEKKYQKKKGKKLKKLSYDPKDSTITFTDDNGEIKRVKLNITDARSVRLAIAKIDRELAKYDSKSVAENKKMLKERDRLIRVLNNYVGSGPHASKSVKGDTSITLSTDELEKFTAKDLNAILEHEKEHIRQFTRSGVSSESESMKLLDDETLKFIKKYQDSPNGKLLSPGHDRYSFEMLADAAAVRKYGCRTYTKTLEKLVDNLIGSFDDFKKDTMTNVSTTSLEFKRLERLYAMTNGDLNKPMSDEEVHKAFKSIRIASDHLSTASNNAVNTVIASLKYGSISTFTIITANIKAIILTFVNLIKSIFSSRKYTSKKAEEAFIKEYPPEKRRAAIKELCEKKLKEELEKVNIKDLEARYKKLCDINRKFIEIRIQFCKDFAAWDRKRRFGLVKEYLVNTLSESDVFCQEYVLDNIVNAMLDAEEITIESGDYNPDFVAFHDELKEFINESYSGVFDVSSVNGKCDKFNLVNNDEDTVTTITYTSEGCDIISRMKDMVKKNAACVSLADAANTLKTFFENPATIMENALYDTGRFGTIYMEADDEADNEEPDPELEMDKIDEIDKEAAELENPGDDDDNTDDDSTDEAESTEETPESEEVEEEKEVTVTEDEDTDDGDSKDIENFGNDNSDVQNDFDPKDIEALNKLIAAESEAINDYFDAAKDTNNELLGRLYSDIGHEERFHLEQLLYAKSTLTGEKYEPRDPEVKKEYEELIAMGMDEETASMTAIDKTYTLGSDDGDDSDMEKLEQESFELCQQLYRESMFTDMIINEYAKTEHDNTLAMFFESYYAEAVDNVTSAPKEITNLPNPIKLLAKGIKMFINALLKLSRILRDSMTRDRIKRKRRNEWIKRHGISGLFKSGVSLYFYDDAQSRISIEAPIQYVDLLYRITVMVGKECGITVTTKHKTIKHPLTLTTIQQGLDTLKGAVFTKTKVIVTDANKDAIAQDFFGYSDKKLAVPTQHGGDDAPVTHDSINGFNTLSVLAGVTKQYGEIADEVVTQLNGFEGNPSSIYYKNRNLYNKCVKYMEQVVKHFNILINAMSHDINVLLKLDNGLLAMTRERDRVEQTGGTWEGPDVRTSGSLNKSPVTKGQHTEAHPEKGGKKKFFKK